MPQHICKYVLSKEGSSTEIISIKRELKVGKLNIKKGNFVKINKLHKPSAYPIKEVK